MFGYYINISLWKQFTEVVRNNNLEAIISLTNLACYEKYKIQNTKYKYKNIKYIKPN